MKNVSSLHFQAQASTDADRGNAIEPKPGGGGGITRFFLRTLAKFLSQSEHRNPLHKIESYYNTRQSDL